MTSTGSNTNAPTRAHDPPVQSRADTLTVGGPASAIEVRAGDRLGRYVIGERLGAGGMGSVHRAHDPELGRDVAVKLLHQTDRRARQRMRREAQAMASLSHPNVLPVYDVAEHQGRLFIAMELVEGQNLRQWLSRKARPWPQIVATFIEAGRGLHAAHEAGFIHRDFKPANVLVGDDGRVRVMDFGLARPLTADSELEPSMGAVAMQGATEVTEAGMVVGTPPYMAPEQFMNEPVDRAADQYGFCVALWEGLAGERPWRTITDRRELLARKLAGAPDPRVALAAVPRPLQEAIVRGLEADPRARFPSMVPLLEALCPPRSRSRARSVVAAGIVTSLLVAGGAGLASRGGGPAAGCDEAESLLAGTWDDAARTRVRDGLLATGRSYAAQTWSRVEPRLDAYAAAWAEERRSACRAAVGDEEGADARLRCLRGGRQALEALTRVLAEADDTALSRSVSAMDRLPDPRECAAATDGADEPPRPTDPARLVVMERAEEQLAWIRALIQIGRYADALDRAQALLREVETLDYPPLWIDVALELGRAMDDERRPEGVELMERTYFEAQAHGLERRAARAALLLVRYLGITLEKGNDAERWIEHAEGLMARLHDPHLQADFHEIVGEAHHSAGRTAEAIEHKERALELARELYPSNHRAVLVAQTGLGTIYETVGRYDEALALAEQSKAVIVESRGPRHPHVAQLLHSIAQVQWARDEWDEARKNLELAREINEEVFGPDHTRVAGSLNNLAVVELHAEHYDRAVELLERSLEIRRSLVESGHPVVARVLVNLGEAYHELGRTEEATQAYRRAGRIVEQAYGRRHEIMVAVLGGQATIAWDDGRRDEASALLEEAAALAEAVFGPGHPTTRDFRERARRFRERLSSTEGDAAKP